MRDFIEMWGWISILAFACAAFVWGLVEIPVATLIITCGVPAVYAIFCAVRGRL